MSEPVAETVAGWLVAAAGIYLAAGLLFAGAFLLAGLGRVDPAAARGSVGFRLIILPGVVALWPLLARRWLRARRSGAGPPEERNPHRQAAELAVTRAVGPGGAGAEEGVQ